MDCTKAGAVVATGGCRLTLTLTFNWLMLSKNMGRELSIPAHVWAAGVI